MCWLAIRLLKYGLSCQDRHAWIRFHAYRIFICLFIFAGFLFADHFVCRPWAKNIFFADNSSERCQSQGQTKGFCVQLIFHFSFPLWSHTSYGMHRLLDCYPSLAECFSSESFII